MSSPVRLSHVVGPLPFLSNCLRAMVGVGSVQSMRMCFADWGVRAHSPELAGRRGFTSFALRDSGRSTIALADLLGRLALPSNGFCFGLAFSHREAVCFRIMFRYTLAISYLSVVLFCRKGLSVCTSFASESARSFPIMLCCEGVHFPPTR